MPNKLPPPPLNFSTISIIIPLYNAEKHITECLDSLLNQTFQNFEVVIVDDCSTDNGFNIIKSYVPKFNGRLMFVKNKKYSGKKSALRNMGLKLASGEYVLFLNSENFILTTALETLYNAAKENDADVVYTSAGYVLNQSNDITLLRDAESNRLLKKGINDEPTLIIDDADKNIRQLLIKENHHTLWTRFVRRDLLLKNKIGFPDINNGGEFLWVAEVYCRAKRFLRLPTPLYYCRSCDIPKRQLEQKISDFVTFAKALKKVANENKFLQENPAYCREALIAHFGYYLEQTGKYQKDFLNSMTCDILYHAFDKDNVSAELITSLLASGTKPTQTVVEDNSQLSDTAAENLTPEVAVSIIIPMYNAEDYIGEALQSILDQTLQSFEVIVVDDCSKDNSYKVVESYIPKFDGRLKLLSMGKNSGSAPAPRNKGFLISRGEYIFFMDVDDMFTKTALEEMYGLAKEYNADAVYCENYYMSTGTGQAFIDNIYLADEKIQEPPFVDKPTLETTDLAKRIELMTNKNYWVTPWQRLVSRKLLVENSILFPEIIGCDDVVWCFEVLCCAKRFLRVPNACYIRRMSDESFTRSKKPPNRVIHQWVDVTIRGLKFVNNFMDRVPFFQEQQNYRYEAFASIARASFEVPYTSYSKLQPDDIYNIFLKEFSKDTGDNSVLVSYLCTKICENTKALREYKKDLQRADKDSQGFQTLLEEKDTEIKRLKNEMYLKAYQPAKPVKLPFRPITCAVSVIISLYNYEKYVGECLDSLLAQTFQNFEVIVVDDCSTDNGVAVVKKYAPKFNGRLQFAQMEINSGGGGMPRNKGLELASGEYVFFMDADDVFTKNALQEMYSLARKFNADTVYCEKYFMSEGSGQEFIDNIRSADDRMQPPPYVDKPTIETTDLAERIKGATKKRYWVTAWLRLVQRKLLIDNNITFDSLIASNDVNWTFKVLFCSKRFLRVPNAYYVRRIHNESVSFHERTQTEWVHKWMDRSIRSLKNIDEFMGGIKFFKDNPKARYEVLNYFLQSDLSNTFKECMNANKFAVYDMMRQSFSHYLGAQDVLVSCLVARTYDQGKWWDNRYKKLEKESKANIASQEEEIKKLKAKIESLSTQATSTSYRSNYAVSVVIPMYNAEEFIGECLDSLLMQTFQDFEVIVADDCSTDNSVEVVKSYEPKFNGRLRLTQAKKNSGGGGYLPRNAGLRLASGKYVIFLDSDDFLLGTALETLYNAAEENAADVVYSSIYYDVKKPNDVYLHRDGFAVKLLKDGVKDKTELIVDDTEKLFAEFLSPGSGEGNFRHPWSKFVRRELLLENEILFPDIVTGGDCIWCINVYAYAKRFLRLPIPLYFYRRYNGSSITRITRTPQEQLSYWIAAFIAFLKALNALQSRTEILQANPNWCYEATRGGHFEWCLNRTYDARKELSNKEVYEILYHELSKNKDLFEAAVPFFFSVIDNEKKNREEESKTLKDLQKEITRLKKKA